MVLEATALTLRCPACGVPVEDRGLCVGCWDREAHWASPPRGWRVSMYERNFWIAEARRQGASVREVMAVTGLSKRTVLHVWQQAATPE